MPSDPIPSRELLATLYTALREAGDCEPLMRLQLARMIQTVSNARYARGQEQITEAVDWDGLKFVVDTGDRLGAEFYHGLYRELPEALALLYSLPPGGRLVDVGANFGFFSVLGARQVGPAGKVVALEPHPRARALLERNVAANPPEGVVSLFGLAIAEKDGRSAFYFADEPAFSGLCDTGRARIESVADVPTRSLDSLANEQSWGPVHGLKIDVEGFEHAVLEGAANLLGKADELVVLLECSAKNLTPERRQRLGSVLSHCARTGLKAWWIDWRTRQPRPIAPEKIETDEENESIFLVRENGAAWGRLAAAIKSVATVMAESRASSREPRHERLRLAWAMRSQGMVPSHPESESRLTAPEGNSDTTRQVLAGWQEERDQAAMALAVEKATSRRMRREYEDMVASQNQELRQMREWAEGALARARTEYENLEGMLKRESAELSETRRQVTALLQERESGPAGSDRS